MSAAVDALLGFQRAGVRFLARRPMAILADDMGLGKTLQALVAANALRKRTIIVCPKAVATNWAREINKWGFEGRIGVVSGRKPCVEQHAGARWIICPYSIVSYRANEIAKLNSIVICDEAHMLKNPDTKRSAGVAVLTAQATHRWMLTGTPVQNRPVDLLGMLTCMRMAEEHRWAKPWNFRTRYCDPKDVYSPALDREIRTYTGSSNLAELRAHLKASGVLLRRLKEKHLKDLPTKDRNEVWVDVPFGKIDIRDCDERTAALIAAIKEGIRNGEKPEFEAFSGVRGDQGVRKAPVVAEYVQSAYADDEPVLVLCYHKRTCMELVKLFGDEATYTHGGVSDGQHERALESFKTLRKRILVATIGKIGTGVDGLQHVCRHSVFAELSWVPAELLQGEDRIWRMGQGKPVTITYVMAEGSMDGLLWEAIKQKMMVTKAIYG